jgi:hypothetical protein
MTKEELINNSTWVDETLCSMIYTKDMKEFFKSNICIPRGENRHPYADILHEWIEGDITLEELSVPMNRWDETDTVAFGYKYRIKPPESVYECMYYDKNGKIDWLTDDEFALMIKSKPVECYKAYETKRIRKEN